jgi:hypothetical protein
MRLRGVYLKNSKFSGKVAGLTEKAFGEAEPAQLCDSRRTGPLGKPQRRPLRDMGPVRGYRLALSFSLSSERPVEGSSGPKGADCGITSLDNN